MRFHNNHGGGITLLADNTKAIRERGFCDGIVFSGQPLSLCTHYTLLLSHVDGWSGALRLGVTSINPSSLTSLPRYACPKLIGRPGFWVRPIKEKYALTGSRLTFRTARDGCLHIYINNEHKGALFTNLPTAAPLWLLVDVYGNTNGVTLVKDDSIPVEVVARGPDALKAYQNAQSSGTAPFLRTRLCVVGQDGVGKSHLVATLLGEQWSDNSVIKDSIDITRKCKVTQEDPMNWTNGFNVEEYEFDEFSKHEEIKDEILLSTEEYNVAIAQNIVRDLQLQQRNKDKRPASGQNNRALPRLAFNSAIRRPKSNKVGVLQTKRTADGQEKRTKQGQDNLGMDYLDELPDSIVKLVERYLKENEPKQQWDMQELDISTPSKPISLNIWDFAGQSVFYTSHIIYLSHRAIYIVVFDLSLDLDTPAVTQVSVKGDEMEWKESEMTNLDFILHWLFMIWVHATSSVVVKTPPMSNEPPYPTMYPPILLVGTHKGALHPEVAVQDSLTEEKFQRIRQAIKGRPFEPYVCREMYAVELTNKNDVDVGILKKRVTEIAYRLPHLGQEIPLRWLRVERAFKEMRERGIKYLDFSTAHTVAEKEGIRSLEELQTALQFLHEHGIIVYFGNTRLSWDHRLFQTVVVDPKWLVHIFSQVITPREIKSMSDSAERLGKDGIMEDSLMSHLWNDSSGGQSVSLLDACTLVTRLTHDKTVVGLLEGCDLTLRLLHDAEGNSCGQSDCKGCLLVPCRIRKKKSEMISPQPHDAIFYLMFNDFLSDGMYERLMCRLLRWSQEQGGRQFQFYQRMVKFSLGADHHFILQMAPLRYTRIKVTVRRNFGYESDEEFFSLSTSAPPPPYPHMCAKLRHYLEESLHTLSVSWTRRLSWRMMVECTCERACVLHKLRDCADDNCLHFLPLDECLAKKIVCCDYRRVRTDKIRRWFPPHTLPAPRPQLTPVIMREKNAWNTWYDPDQHPQWMNQLAKQLNASSEGADWTELAKKLGYKQSRIEEFSSDLNPAMVMLKDWILTSGNTSFSVEMISSCLEQIRRDDLVELLNHEQDSNTDLPPIFLSYQWGQQEEAIMLRMRLELSGFPCWMDVGQMGGGDLLYNKLYQGLSAAKVVICCLSPSYCVSQLCIRELEFADLMRKPVVPVMVQSTPWPPPGPVALLLGSHVYVDMAGIGGHGGSGKQGDWEDRFQEVVTQLCKFVTPRPTTTLKTLHVSALEVTDLGGSLGKEQVFQAEPQSARTFNTLPRNTPITATPTLSRTPSSVASQQYTPSRSPRRRFLTSCILCAIL